MEAELSAIFTSPSHDSNANIHDTTTWGVTGYEADRGVTDPGRPVHCLQLHGTREERKDD